MTEDSTPTSSSSVPAAHRRAPMSFVRRSTRLSPQRQLLWEASLGKEIIDVPRDQAKMSVDPNWRINAAELFGREAPLIIDIGIGHGESTVAGAEALPDTDFLAIEVYTPGLAKLLVQLKERGLTNVRGIEANAPEVLETLDEQTRADEVWIFFPDPWQKTRYHKRRLVQPDFADLLTKVLKPGGLVRLATDWSHYAEQMRTVFDEHPAFENLHPGRAAGAESPLTKARSEGTDQGEPEPDYVDEIGGWAPRFELRPITSFERKATQAGRYIHDLTYRLQVDN